MTVLPLSCYIRTLNEEARLPRILERCRLLSDDIVVVDSGSVDKTCVISEQFGARVFKQEWLGNGFQKRRGEELCLNDWVLDLDADELLSDELIKNIREIFDQMPGAQTIFGLRLITVPPYGAIWNNFAIDTRYKLYNKHHHRMPESRSWDQLTPTKDTKKITLPGPLYHYSFSGVAQMSDKWNKVSTRRLDDGKLKPLWLIRMRIVFAFPIYFIKNYVQKGLWRAGLYGFCISCIGAHGRWLRDVKSYERHMEQMGKKNKGLS
ncbi:MAG: glycosyltransferase family 2 protein [Alphaproteobacteria bacterium]|jgi:glycosyltransferase involved in cell wall biosynthesis